MSRSTSNRNARGNTAHRRRRRNYLIRTFGIPREGDGRKTRIRCNWCPTVMRAEPHVRPIRSGPFAGMLGRFYSWEVDRLVCGHAGGTYAFDNCVPACRKCNQTRCSKACRVGASSAGGSEQGSTRAHRARQGRRMSIDMNTCASCRRARSPHLKLVDAVIDNTRVRMCEQCDGDDFKIAHVKRRLRGEAP